MSAPTSLLLLALLVLCVHAENQAALSPEPVAPSLGNGPLVRALLPPSSAATLGETVRGKRSPHLKKYFGGGGGCSYCGGGGYGGYGGGGYGGGYQQPAKVIVVPVTINKGYGGGYGGGGYGGGYPSHGGCGGGGCGGGYQKPYYGGGGGCGGNCGGGGGGSSFAQASASASSWGGKK